MTGDEPILAEGREIDCEIDAGGDGARNATGPQEALVFRPASVPG